MKAASAQASRRAWSSEVQMGTYRKNPEPSFIEPFPYYSKSRTCGVLYPAGDVTNQPTNLIAQQKAGTFPCQLPERVTFVCI